MDHLDLKKLTNSTNVSSELHIYSEVCAASYVYNMY